jgi:hypothetical protein
VDVVDAATSQVWLDGPGKILLYDRPTMEWLRTAPPSEQLWQYALFGNPAPPKDAGKPSSPWIFWPRRPALVEAAVARGLADAPFEQRKGLVFYGRSENAIQEDRRSRHNWAPACDEFVHVAGESKYPFTQEEYLEKLAGARFGLCLAGFGLKCHREVECMAMGCVPIVAPEVDMTSYAEPPQEGIHFFRAQTPEAAAAAVAATGPEMWAAMSAACKAWWQRNASVEGSWRTTERLAAAAPAAEA